MPKTTFARCLLITAIVLATVGATWAAAQLNWVNKLDREFLDLWSGRSDNRASGEVVVIAIDDASLIQIGRWPWSRARHAELIDKLHDAGAGPIAIDLLLSDPDDTDPAGDHQLAAAIERHGGVLLPAPTQGHDSSREEAQRLLQMWPAARFAHSDVVFDDDGMVRQLYRWNSSRDTSLPSLPLALTNPALALGSRHLRAFAETSGTPYWQLSDPVLISDLDLPEQLPIYSYAQVLGDQFDARVLRGKSILIGVTATGIGQRFATPKSVRSGRILSGVELSAVAADAFVSHDEITPTTPFDKHLLNIGLGLLAAMIVLFTPGARLRWFMLGAAIVVTVLTPALQLWLTSSWSGTSAALVGISVAVISSIWLRHRENQLRAQRVMHDAQRLAASLVEAVIALDGNDRVVFAHSTRPGLLPEIRQRAGERPPPGQLLRTIPPIQQLLAAPRGQVQTHLVELFGPAGSPEKVTLHVSPSRIHATAGRMITIVPGRETVAEDDAHGTRVDLDPMTGLSTRGSMWNELRRLERADDVQSISFLLIALDGFKRINEALGAAEGDRVLVEVARRIRAGGLRTDVIARWSGDQFAVLLHDADAERAADQLQRAIGSLRIQPGDLHVAARIGAASIARGEAVDLGKLVTRAENSMREVKRDGGGRWRLADASEKGWTTEKLAMEQALRRAISGQQFVMHYQPIIDIERGEFTSMEALIRWRHPEQGLLLPSAFLPMVEEAGLDVALGELAFLQVQADMETMAQRGITLPISVNVSSRHFERPDFAAFVAGLADHAKMRIEVTESMALIDPERASQQVLALARHGINVSLDDFGCGHSSLAPLRSLQIRQLKIDRSFVADAMLSSGAASLVTGIIRMAEALDMEVVGEGIETPAQSQWLAQQGCRLQQGYLFAKPTPMPLLPALLAGRIGPPALPAPTH
ncbi:MAG: EAL domain-containing protein [Pseudomonadota bacterium]|nr:EAL domain-containing protein [Pseudomonadota bacterium]